MSQSAKIGYFIINMRLGNYKGHSINISKTVEGMRTAGLDIQIVAPQYEPDFDFTKVFKDYTLTTTIPVHWIWVPGRLPSRTNFFYYTVVVWFWLLWKIIRGQCSFMYVRSEYLFPLTWLSKLTKIPLFYEIHRVALKDRLQKYKNHLAHGSQGLIVLNDLLKETFFSQNKNIHVEHDAVDYEHFSVSDNKTEYRRELSLPADATIVLYAGSVQKIKGIETIVENAKIFPSIQFYILGWVKDDMKEYLSDVPENVHILGKYTHELLPSYLKAADALLIPYPRGPQSQSPMTLFEYMATGRPVISSDIPNIREVLPDENLFFTPEDNRSYQKAIQSFLDSHGEFSSVAELNRKSAQEHTYLKRGSRITDFVRNNL